MTGVSHVAGIEIDGELGRGAHSIVYRGTHNGVRCALKLPRVRARWTRWVYREAVALARVKHPLLPAVLEVGEDDGLPYLVMELVEGETLGDRIAGVTLEEEAVIDLAEQLASVLAAVHGAGLVHRDVKPRNIIAEQSTGLFKLVDFGFATPLERADTADASGTTAYAAPEQLSASGRVDDRSDLYALGRVLFECLTGQLPPEHTAPLEQRSRLIRRGASPGLAELIIGLLRPNPEQRYPDAHAVASDLHRIRSGVAPLGALGYRATPHRPPLVGRTDHLETLLLACHASMMGAGAVVAIEGLRGGGKSSLLAALDAAVTTGPRVVVVASRQDAPPLAVLRAIFEAYCQPLRSDGAESLRVAIGNLASVAALVAPACMGAILGREALEASKAIAETASSESLAEGAAEVLVRFAHRLGPLVVAVDDAHWMDPVSADALLRVAHRCATAPLSLFIVARPCGALDRFVAAGQARSSRIELPRLVPDEVGKIISDHLGDVNIEEAVVTRIAAMADGTPMGVLEVLGAFLDVGALRPQARAWLFDPARIDLVVLPPGALVLLGRRVGDLAVATRRVLEAAAVLGATFEDRVLSQVLEITDDDLGYGLASARRAGVVEAFDTGWHRFVHNSLCEKLVEELEVTEVRRLHQRAGEVLDSPSGGAAFEDLCAAATHFAAGEPERDPARVYRVARAAASAALARFDNDMARRFQVQAARAAEGAGIGLDVSFFTEVGEALLRMGALADSSAAFESALGAAADPATRAMLLGRLSWVFQARAEPDRAWAVLALAFAALGEQLPVESIGSVLTTSSHLVRGTLRRALSVGAKRDHSETDLLCALHYQNARLGLEYMKPARVIQSAFEGLALSEHSGSSTTRARALAFHGVLMIALGLPDASSKDLLQAREIARLDGDAATTAFCVQMDATVASWAGDLDRALLLYRECVELHGPWLELNEFFLVVVSAEIVEALRGRATEASAWVTRALDRLRRSRTRPARADFLIHHARAAILAAGGDYSQDAWLSEELASVPPACAGQGFHRLVSWGPRARFYFETSDFGDAFEALVDEFQREGHKPRTVHIAVAEYYVNVVHARVHQCLHAHPPGARLVRALKSAVADLRATARVPLLRAHALFGEGCVAWYEGQPAKAEKKWSEAESVANRESCPWVLYAVARVRAHVLRRAGREVTARDQARMAEVLASDHGAATRARVIREEFALPVAIPEAVTTISLSGSRISSRSNRQLSALLQVARAPRRDLRTEEQAGAILDELIQILDASRASLLFVPETGTVPVTVGRSVEGSIVVDEPTTLLLRAVQERGAGWPAEDGAPLELAASRDPERTAVLPLFLYDKAAGAISIERADGGPPFSQEDRNLLLILSHQVPIALEIARLLFEREQLHASLQHAKKMEAMGALAGGLAHDFNNMLAAMRVALGAAQERATEDSELSIELEIISQATTRAAQLTGQLLSFSRHQPVPVAVHEVNQLISTLEPMLRRVVGAKVDIVVSLSSAVDAVEVDQGSFDQALVNLLINARDAMPEVGGKVMVSTRNVVLTEGAAQRANVAPGEYVEIEIADTGAGMSAETMSRIFEPFYTTKAVGSGSGLGLAMVYAFARNCGGSIEVESEIGAGTKFRLHLRRVERARAARSVRPLAMTAPGPMLNEERDTILVVDDDDLVRRSISKILERNGYRVLAANSSNEALRVVGEQGGRIGLVILDVLMPGTTGPELGRRLFDLKLPAKLLFVSGFSPESIPIADAQVAADMLLQKPFSQSALLERVRQLMNKETN